MVLIASVSVVRVRGAGLGEDVQYIKLEQLEMNMTFLRLRCEIRRGKGVELHAIDVFAYVGVCCPAPPSKGLMKRIEADRTKFPMVIAMAELGRLCWLLRGAQGLSGCCCERAYALALCLLVCVCICVSALFGWPIWVCTCYIQIHQ